MAKFIDGSGVERVIPKLTLGRVAKIEAEYGVKLHEFFSSPEVADRLLTFMPFELARLAGVLSNVPKEDMEAFIAETDGDALDRMREALLESVTDFLPRHLRKKTLETAIAVFQDPDFVLSAGSNKASDSPAPSA